MKEIVLGDWTRILRGSSPWSFVPEALLRLLVVYVLLLLAFRLMGRRLSSQLSRNELLAVVSLAAAVGPALLTADQGLLPPVIIAVWVVLLQTAMTYATVRSHRFENAIDGVVSTLVRDGKIDLRALHHCAISSGRLQAQLRTQGLTNLGQVERCFFEPGGEFSTVRRADEQPGLSLVPGWDTELRAKQRTMEGLHACRACGAVAPARRVGGCAECGSEGSWEPAVCGRR